MLFTSYSTPSKINQYTTFNKSLITKEEAVKNNYLLFIIINSTIIENKIVRTNRDQKQSIHYLYKKYHT